jgi:hypothetical protein
VTGSRRPGVDPAGTSTRPGPAAGVDHRVRGDAGYLRGCHRRAVPRRGSADRGGRGGERHHRIGRPVRPDLRPHGDGGGVRVQAHRVRSGANRRAHGLRRRAPQSRGGGGRTAGTDRLGTGRPTRAAVRGTARGIRRKPRPGPGEHRGPDRLRAARDRVAGLRPRMGVADVAEGGGWLSWPSQIGWMQQVRAYAGDRWWVLLMPMAMAAVSVPVAMWLRGRRDLRAGLLQDRPGPAHGPARPVSPGWRGGSSADCSSGGWSASLPSASSSGRRPTR